MSKQTVDNYADLFDTLSRFMAKPPVGTPVEVIEAFDGLGDTPFLPPRLFYETVEQSPVAISITDPSACILYVNAAFERLTGYPRSDVIGKNESILSSKSTPNAVYRELWQTITHGQVWGGTLVNLRQDGAEYLARLSISPVLDGAGQIVYFLGMHHDITEVHALEQRLKFQTTLTEAALNAAPMMVAMIDGNGQLLLDNPAYRRLALDLAADPAGVLMQALAGQAGLDPADICLGGQGFTNIEVRIEGRSAQSPRWFSCSGVPIKGLDDAATSYFRSLNERVPCCLLLIANEISDSRNRVNEARLNMIRANMAEQQMVQTMREAIHAALFKLQAPLNVIRAAMKMSASGVNCGGFEPVLQQALSTGEEAIESLHNALPGPRVEQVVQVNLNELLHEVLRLSTDSLLAAGIVVDWRAAAVLPSLSGRPNALRSMFKYLIDNAIQSLNESGHDYREIRLETAEDRGELVVSIMDNGVGIAEAALLRVFEPFYCGWAQAREHAGMGLTLAQEVVNGHGGGIELDHHFIGGCRLFVRLPVARSEEASP